MVNVVVLICFNVLYVKNTLWITCCGWCVKGQCMSTWLQEVLERSVYDLDLDKESVLAPVVIVCVFVYGVHLVNLWVAVADTALLIAKHTVTFAIMLQCLDSEQSGSVLWPGLFITQCLSCYLSFNWNNLLSCESISSQTIPAFHHFLCPELELFSIFLWANRWNHSLI